MNIQGATHEVLSSAWLLLLNCTDVVTSQSCLAAYLGWNPIRRPCMFLAGLDMLGLPCYTKHCQHGTTERVMAPYVYSLVNVLNWEARYNTLLPDNVCTTGSWRGQAVWWVEITLQEKVTVTLTFAQSRVFLPISILQKDLNILAKTKMISVLEMLIYCVLVCVRLHICIYTHAYVCMCAHAYIKIHVYKIWTKNRQFQPISSWSLN